MYLVALLTLVLTGGLLLRGAWDVWAQSLTHLTAIAGFSLWLLGRIFVGFVPLPSRRELAWLAALTALGLASVAASPVPGLTRPAGFNFLQALWLFLVVPAVSKDHRVWIDQGLRGAAWVLVLLAFHQHFSGAYPRAPAALVNENVFAGTALMLLPLALERGDRVLALGLLICLGWAHSVGAWLGLALALMTTFRRRSAVLSWAGLALFLIGSVAVYQKFQGPEVLHRLAWWGAAGRMILASPILGFGPGSFESLAAAFQPAGALRTAYAHQYFLETLAELGAPAGLLWFWGIAHCVGREASYKRFGALAVLFQSLWDYSLSMPGNLWLFAYLCASSVPESRRGVNVPLNLKPAWAVLVASLGLAMGSGVEKVWRADRRLAQGVEAWIARDLGAAERLLGEAVRLGEGEPQALKFRAELLEARFLKERNPALRLEAAAAWEEASRASPYDPAVRQRLARFRAMAGGP